MTKTYTNKTGSVAVVMDGECLGANAVAKTCVRKTTCGRFAVIRTTGSKLIKVTDTESHARNYNSLLN